MNIRPYETADRAKCIALLKSNMPLFFDPTELPDFENWLNGQDKKQLAYKTSIAEYYYVITDTQNTVMGCGGFYIPREQQLGNMVWGMVNNIHHKKGFGRHLLEFRINTLQKLYPNYLITLDTTQHSYRFFEKLGFTVTHIRKDFYAAGMDRYDMVKK